MQDVRDGDGDGFDVRVGDQFLVLAVDAGHVELLGQIPAAVLVESGDGDDFGAGILGESLQVQDADPAADDADLELFRFVHRHPFAHDVLRAARSMASVRLADKPHSCCAGFKVMRVTSGGQRKRIGGR